MKSETKAKLAKIWDKASTGILLFLFASPLLILLYLILWFLSK